MLQLAVKGTMAGKQGVAGYPECTLQQRTLWHAPVHQQLQANQLRRRAPRARQVLVHALVGAHDVVAPAVVVAVHGLLGKTGTHV